MEFTHLHLHTDFSLLDGVSQIPALIEKLQKEQMKACAITDHGNLYGGYKFFSACKAAGIKPIIGAEIYIAPRSMQDKEKDVDNKYMHLVLLAKNFQGYKNLIKILSAGHMEGFYYKPRVDFELLSKYSEGLIALSACLGGIISRPLLNKDKKLAVENLKKYSNLYKDNFYIEIQRNGIKEQETVNKSLLEMAKEYSLPIVATCDAHYLEKEDYELQEILWAISDGHTIFDPNRRKASAQEFYVKSTKEMQELFSDLPEAIENTQKIVDAIEDYDINLGRVEPVFQISEKTKKDHKKYVADKLQEMAYEGAKIKYGKLTDEVKKRIDYELKVIDDKGYNDYFLIMHDFVDFCRKNGIVTGMRGSGCGSVVAYSIGITHVEPFEWELYFERFLNYERADPPDFDIDVADDRRDELIQYAIDKYGIDCVKQIGTFSKLMTRQAIRDVARVLGIDLSIADRLSKKVIIQFGKSKSLDYMMENDVEFAQIINSSPELLRLADIVRKLSGVHRGVSTHACGIVITPQPVVEYCPIQRDAHGAGIGMTQYEMFDIDPMGLIKFDFLGLKNLSVIGRTIRTIKATKDPDFDLAKIDYKDKKVFETIMMGHTVGIFQMEGGGMKKVVSEIRPDSLEEICYVLAAYRPGPMEFIPDFVSVKRGKKNPEYIVPEMKEILEVTNGVITYQEQIMKLLNVLAGYELGAASVVMKAMSKKKMDKVEAEKPKFMEGGIAKGFDEKALEEIWEKLLRFANYGFNKAHSSSYAHVSYWTAYLKTHYPFEFMCSLLESDLEKFDRLVIDMEECKRLGIKVLSPSINKSYHYFRVEDDVNIRIGLGAIKNVGVDICKDIVEDRKKNGDFLNFDDFIYRANKIGVGKKIILYLVQAGALDEFGDRGGMISLLDNLYDFYRKKVEKEANGQKGLFTTKKQDDGHITFSSQIPTDKKMTALQMLEYEKELLGVYISSHPLDQFEELFISKGVVNIVDLDKYKDGELVLIGGYITNIKRITTKNGDSMAFVTIEDRGGRVDIVIFPKSLETMQPELVSKAPILFAGKVSRRNDSISILANKAKAIDPAKHIEQFDGIIFRIRDWHTEQEVQDLKESIKTNGGDVKVKIVNYKDGENSIFMLKHTIKITDKIKQLQDRFV